MATLCVLTSHFDHATLHTHTHTHDKRMECLVIDRFVRFVRTELALFVRRPSIFVGFIYLFCSVNDAIIDAVMHLVATC